MEDAAKKPKGRGRPKKVGVAKAEPEQQPGETGDLDGQAVPEMKGRGHPKKKADSDSEEDMPANKKVSADVPSGVKPRGCPPGGWPKKKKGKARGCPPGGWPSQGGFPGKSKKAPPTGKPRGRPPGKNKEMAVENGGTDFDD